MRLSLLWFGLLAAPALAQPKAFAVALGGISTLSGDTTTRFGDANEVSLYKPENGPAVNLGAGVHLNDWISVQGNYVWNRNDVVLTNVRDSARAQLGLALRQDAVVGDLLLYFRGRREWARPYLSVGTGAVRLRDELQFQKGTPPFPGRISATNPLLRVAVGIDLMHRSGWGFRYSFSETISDNPISSALQPPGVRNLANFQNLFGFVRYF